MRTGRPLRNTFSPDLLTVFMTAVLAVALAACAAPAAKPFQMIDDHSVVYHGTYGGNDQHIEITIGDKSFHGFYIVGGGTSQSTATGFGLYRPLLFNNFSTFTTNQARAHMSSAEGEHISCELLFDVRRAAGECKSSGGENFQFVADER
jgi:hypothetical protein